MQAHILVVEDESDIREMIRVALQRDGHIIHCAASVAQAHDLMSSQKMDLAVVDWMLPASSGLELVRTLRKNSLYSQIPIVMLTARSDEHDITSGLDAGADDYVTKPFSPRELQSRIKALLRRYRDFHQGESLQHGPLLLDNATHRVLVNDKEVDFGHTEFKLLAFLMQHPDRVYSRAQLLDHVWGPGTYIEERTVDVHILRIRKNLKPHNADYILETIRGAGYRLANVQREAK